MFISNLSIQYILVQGGKSFDSNTQPLHTAASPNPHQRFERFIFFGGFVGPSKMLWGSPLNVSLPPAEGERCRRG